MADQSFPRGEQSIRWRDGLLFLPWIGLAFGELLGPYAGWASLCPMLLAGSPIALYLALERLESRGARTRR